jgi:serine/threonine protein kinase
MEQDGRNASISTEPGTSTNPKLDQILSILQDQAARDTFKAHDISDLWLPIPRQTARRLLADSRKEKVFLDVQDDILDAKITIADDDTMRLTTIFSHNSLEDSEELVEELRVLGEGAFGVVEEVNVTTELGTTNCVRKRIGRPKQLNAQKAILTAFTREINVMRQVQHQHCVRFLGSYTDFDHVNIISSPVADMDLATLLNLPPTAWGRQVIHRGLGCLCVAVNFLHQRSIRHEDLKPQNILIHGDNILLTDFGFSLDFSNDSVSTTTGRPSAWTMRYAAPEALDFQPRNRATDIYSLGCVLLEMVSAYDGISLDSLKSKWQSTGNGQSSFARNPVALKAWFEARLHNDSNQALSKLDHVCRLIRTMLNNHRNHRPTSEQIIHSLSDVSKFVRWGDEFVGCKGPVPCSDLFHKPEAHYLLRSTMKRLDSLHNFANHLYPFLNQGMKYRLLTSEGDMLVAKPDLTSLTAGDYPIHLHEAVRQACNNVYEQASKSRVGATEHFWDIHQRREHRPLDELGWEDAWVSAHLVLYKHVVCTRILVESQVRMDSLPIKRVLQIALLPICLPRSVYFGNFFHVLSWSSTDQKVYGRSTYNRVWHLTSKY